MTDYRCKRCLEMKILTAPCRGCNQRKVERGEYIGLMSGDLREMKPIKDYTDNAPADEWPRPLEFNVSAKGLR